MPFVGNDFIRLRSNILICFNAQKNKVSIKEFLSKCDHIRKFQRILLRLVRNFTLFVKGLIHCVA